MNVRRLASSEQRVNASSNWSTMTTGRAGGGAGAAEPSRSVVGGAGLGQSGSVTEARQGAWQPVRAAGGAGAGVARRAHAATASRTARGEFGVPGSAADSPPRGRRLRESGIRRVSSARGSPPGTSCSDLLAGAVPGPPSAPLLQGGHQPGVQQGGLPRPRGAHEHDQAARPLRRAELGDEGVRAPLPAEEPAGVLLAVRGQPPVRGTRRRGRPGPRPGAVPPLRRSRGAVADGVGHGALPQALPLGHVVQARGHRRGPRAPGLGYQDVQHGGEGGELGGHVLGPPPVADPLGGHPYGPPPLVDPLKLDDRLGHALEGRVTGLLVQQREPLREGGACP